MSKERNGPFKFWKDATFVELIAKVEAFAWLPYKMTFTSVLKAKLAMFAYYLHLNYFDENEWENERWIYLRSTLPCLGFNYL